MADMILFYDGECSFCNSTVQWVLRKNKAKSIYFAPLGGETSLKLLPPELQAKELDSIIFYNNGKLSVYSTAAIEIAKNLKFGWNLLYVLIVVPPFVRNAFYKWFAKRRYRWFGKQTYCLLPDMETRKRFLP